MSYACDIYYKPPTNADREAALTEAVSRLGGRLDFREEPENDGICLTFEFASLELAETAARSLRQQGEHIEGPYDYGP